MVICIYFWLLFWFISWNLANIEASNLFCWVLIWREEHNLWSSQQLHHLLLGLQDPTTFSSDYGLDTANQISWHFCSHSARSSKIFTLKVFALLFRIFLASKVMIRCKVPRDWKKLFIYQGFVYVGILSGTFYY